MTYLKDLIERLGQALRINNKTTPAKVQAGPVEVPVVETPVVQAPVVQAPVVEAPVVVPPVQEPAGPPAVVSANTTPHTT